jgi:hypothetical protein
VPGGALGADQPSLDDQLILARYVLLWQRVLMTGPREERFDRSSRAAWAVPAALAAVVTAYLAWGAWISARLTHPVAPGDAREFTRRPWAKLDEFVREDNILQLRSVMAEVAAHDRRWVPNRAVVPGSYVELSNRELEDVAHAEHSRWYNRRLAAGRRSTASDEPDDGKEPDKNYDRPWTDLPPKMREKNREDVRTQLAQLEAVGFMPVLPDCGPPAAAGFQRLGEVRATQLATSRPWRNRAGDKLTGVAGDWHVIDESGDERTVRDKEFRDSHEQVDGDRWRRTGTVRAWQVSETVRVRTLEGNAEADPGDWIVQGPSGVRWPVKDEQFTRGYRAYIP